MKGLVDSNGDPIAYAQYEPDQTTPMEGFPIPLKEGVKVAAYDSVPVFVWDDVVSASDPTLFEWVPTTGSTSGLVTRVEDLILAGGGIALDFTASDAKQHNVVVEKCIFAGNIVGSHTLAEGNATISIAMRNCKLVEYSLSAQNPPDLDLTAVGLRFRAYEAVTTSTTGFGRVEALVKGLVTAGSFDSTATSGVDWNWTGSDNDYQRLASSIDGASRIIEVDVAGSTVEHRDNGTTPPSAMPIPEVELAIENCVLNGKALDATKPGWDIAVYTASQSPAQGTYDYTSGYSVEVTGSTLKNFGLAGIYGTVEANCRGDLDAQGTEIFDIASSSTSTGDVVGHAGIHTCASDGYLRLNGVNLDIHDCGGDGVFVHAPETQQNTAFKYPTGALLKLDSCEIHENQDDGLELASGRAYLGGTGGSAGSAAIVGGTIDRLGNSPSMVFYAAKLGSPPDHGEGLVLNSQIYENGDAGIHVHCVNVPGPGKVDAANVRFVNTYVFDNERIGYHAELGTSSTTYDDMYLLTPFVHCTFALNGSWSAQLDLVSGQLPDFIWSGDPFVVTPSREDPKTAFINSILERTNSAAGDFHKPVQDLLVADTVQTSANVGISGTRYVHVLGSLVGTGATDLATPFAYLSNSGLSGAARYFLDSTGTNISSFQNHTSMLLEVFSPESSLDIESDMRPSPSTGDRDKGGDEL